MDFWLNRTVYLEYVKEVSGIKYKIENYVITRLNTRQKIEYVVIEDLKTPDQRPNRIIIINKFFFLK